MKRVGIIGGGVAGLMAAWELSRLGFAVELFEASGELGGLASAFDFDGIRIERYYHFICRNDHALIETCARAGLTPQLRWKSTRTAFFYNGRMYKFGSPLDLLRFSPLSLRDKIRFGINVLHARHFTRWPLLEDRPAKQWLIDRLGARGYTVIWDPLLRVKFDQYHDQISAAWMWHRIHRVATSRQSLFRGESFGHLIGGSETLIGTLARQAREAGARIQPDTRVLGIWAENGKCRGLRLPGPAGSRAVPFDYVISAVPLPVFCQLAPPEETAYLERLRSIRFIGVVCMILRLKQPFSPNYWLNIHDPRVPFNGVIEYSNLYGREAYQGRSILYVPFYLEPTRPYYTCADADLRDEYVRALQVVNPAFSLEWIEGYRVFRDPYAQPICHTHFSRVVPPFETPWQGCYLIESTQLYPADRVISGTLRLAQDVVLRILDREGLAERAPFRRREPGEIPS